MERGLLKEPFLDLLKSLHRWYNSEDALPDTPTDWFTISGLEPPANPDGWFRLGRTPVGEWKLPALPPDWNPAWRVLSRNERTLTVEALEYLDHHAPGAMAAALPPPTPASLTEHDLSLIPEIRDDWSRVDVISCLERELNRREETYPDEIREGRMTPDEAAQELGQMRAALKYLNAQRTDDSSRKSESGTRVVIDETTRQGQLL